MKEIFKDINITCVGWIAPNGHVWGYDSYSGISEHISLAEKICKDYHWVWDEHMYGGAERELERRGFIKYFVKRYDNNQLVLHASQEGIEFVTERQKEVIDTFITDRHLNNICFRPYQSEDFWMSRNDIRNMDFLQFKNYLVY